MSNRETRLEWENHPYSELFAPEKMRQEAMQHVEKDAKFPKTLPDTIKQILCDVLMEQKLLVLKGEEAKHWNNKKVYETQLKLCADATMMPNIWQLAYNKSEKELVNVIKALPRICHHYGTPPMPLSKETKENAKNLNTHISAIIKILQKDEKLKSGLSCKMRDMHLKRQKVKLKKNMVHILRVFRLKRKRRRCENWGSYGLQLNQV